MGEKNYDYENEYRGKGRGKRCTRSALLVDKRLRCTAAHRKTAAQPGSKVRRCKRQIFLIGIESSAMFRGKHSANGSCFDGAEEKTSKGQRKQLVQVVPINSRQFERRKSLRHGANQFYTVCLER